MGPLEILFAFAQIVVPISLALPSLLAYLSPAEPTHILVILFFVPLGELSATIILAAIALFHLGTCEAWVALGVLAAAGPLLAYAFYQLAKVALEVNLARLAE